MYPVKTAGNIKYIIYSWTNVEWARVHGVYVVHPQYEQDFLRRLRSYEEAA